ncbi:hypothetical protein GCM10027598_60540 [Amycolatopsis oliviviridis]|uniref:WXG100-like domain-containing protein n=1 Tax=Amycolatopsis oliviviridis TaxID=1471590 RepID=UPI00174DCB35|nr:hypothetical protein [Amycolatopsis oliviviridis]
MAVPPEVRRFLEFTLGLSWPESDDQGLVALWKAWEAFETAADVLEAAARASGAGVSRELRGETGEFFARFLRVTIADGVAGLGDAAGRLAKMSQNAAADVYKTKVMFVVFAAFTLAAVLHLLATVVGALFTGVVIAAARVALSAIWRALVAQLSQLSVRGGLSQATRTALLTFAKNLALKTGGFAVFGAALMGGTDFGVQARQIAEGDREGWDIRSLTSSLAGGALGGAFAGVFHAAAGGVRRTAFSLRDRLEAEPGHLDALLPRASGSGVTAREVTTAITGPLAAVGDLAYALGQFATAVVAAVPINYLLHDPHGNPFLGALGAFSRYGGGRTTTIHGGISLDTFHPPIPPELTITAPEKPHASTGRTTADAEKSPAYVTDTRYGAAASQPSTPVTGAIDPAALDSHETAPPLATAAPPLFGTAVGVTGAPAFLDASVSPPVSPAVTQPDAPASAGTGPARPLRTIPLPGNGGVAFLHDTYTANVVNAFPHAESGVYRVIVEGGGNDTFLLPGHRDHPTPLPHHDLAVTLAGLPSHLATWNRDTVIKLWSCDLTRAHHELLAPSIRTTLGTALAIAHLDQPITITPSGAVNTPGPHDPDTLHLGPKRKATLTDPAGPGKRVSTDPATQETHKAAGEILRRHGTIGDDVLASHLLSTGVTDLTHANAVKAIARAQAELKKTGELWGPRFVGASHPGRFDPDEPDELTVWLWWHAVTNPGSSITELAQAAQAAGFTVTAPEDFVSFAGKAIEAAEDDGRRNPELRIGNAEDKPAIMARLDRILDEDTHTAEQRTDAAYLTAALTRRHVSGQQYRIRALVAAHLRVRAAGPPVPTSRPDPLPRPARTFLGRSLDIGTASDRVLIEKLAYIAAWSDKTAIPAALAARLIADDLVNGSAADLEKLVSGVVATATRNGDRLVPLSVTDQAHATEVMDRALGVALGTPRLREPERLTDLIRHLRVRHIAGPHEAVTELATLVQQTVADLPPDAVVVDGLSVDPLVLPEAKLDPSDSGSQAAMDELIRTVITERGRLTRSALTFWLRQKIMENPGFSPAIARGLQQAESEGRSWHPAFGGREAHVQGAHRAFTSAEPSDLAAALWLLVIDHPRESRPELARRAEQAGFIGGDRLLLNIDEAIDLAVRDRRRHPILELTEPAHRPAIDELIAALLTDSGRTGPTGSTKSISDLARAYNVAGGSGPLSDAVNAVRDRLTAAAMKGAAGLPVLRPTGTFAGRTLDADVLTDHATIAKLAYAAAWADKSADTGQLIARLKREGVTGSAETLSQLVTDSIVEATRNGDRLETLSVADSGALEAIHARALDILRSEPHLRTPNRLDDLITHMRIRHITGPQRLLEEIAGTALRTPADFTSPAAPFTPLDRSRKFSRGWHEDHQGVTSLATRILAEHGKLDRAQLAHYMSLESARTDAPTYSALKSATALAKADGSMWLPTYRGVVGMIDPGHRSAAVWQLVVDHPNATPTDILYLAQEAGLPNRKGLIAEAQQAVAAAERHGRRPPILKIGDRMKDRSVHDLIDAVLITEPHLDPGVLVLRLYDLNLQGGRQPVRAAVAERMRALAEVTHDADAIAAARKRLTLVPEPTFFDRKLDSGVPADRTMIEKLAYAAARAHKTDSAGQILDWLGANGVTGPREVLTGLVADAIESADRHGDRLVTLTAAVSTHHHAIRERTDDILTNFPELRHSSTPYRVNKLVAQMRLHHITGPQTVLRGIAETALSADFAPPPQSLVLLGGNPGRPRSPLDATAETDLQAIYRRTGELVLQLTRSLAASGELYENSRSLLNPGNPHRVSDLVKHMSQNGISGPAEVRRQHAETVLGVRTGQPVPGKHSIPFSTDGEPVRLVPLPDGVAFVTEADAPAVLDAFSRPAATTLRLIALREDGPDGAFLIPGPDGDLAPADAHRLLDITAAFASTLPAWNRFTELEIWTSATASQHEELAGLVKVHPALGHLALTIPGPMGREL